MKRALQYGMNTMHKIIAETAEGFHSLFNASFDNFDALKQRLARYLNLHPMVKLFLVYAILYCIIVFF